MKNGCKSQVFMALYFDFAERCAVQQKLCSFAMQRDVAVDYSAVCSIVAWVYDFLCLIAFSLVGVILSCVKMAQERLCRNE